MNKKTSAKQAEAADTIEDQRERAFLRAAVRRNGMTRKNTGLHLEAKDFMQIAREFDYPLKEGRARILRQQIIFRPRAQ